MVEYCARIREGTPQFERLALRNKWLAKHEGEWIREKLEPISKCKDPKTKAQLGLYWGFWFLEIHDQLVRDGNTITVRFGNHERNIPYTKTASHEVITALCGYIGDDGEHIRLSGCDKFDGSRWLKNVLAFAEELGMNREKMVARAKELRGDFDTPDPELRK